MKQSRRLAAAMKLTSLLAATALLTMGLAAPSMAATVSQSTAQAVNLDVLGALNVVASNPATSATSPGTGPEVIHTNSPILTALSGQNFLTAGAAGELAEANPNGSSYACSGIVQPGQSLVDVGAPTAACTVAGAGTGGVSLDLSTIGGGVGTLLSTIADVKVTLDALTASGFDNGTAAPTLTSSFANAHVSVCSLLLLCNAALHLGTPIVISLPIPSAPNSNLLTTVITAITGQGGLATVVNALSNLVLPVLTLTTNYQPTVPAGSPASVTALHVGVLNAVGGTSAVTLDLAKATVGPNAPAAGSPVIPGQALPFAFGALGIMALLAGGLFLRRKHSGLAAS